MSAFLCSQDLINLIVNSHPEADDGPQMFNTLVYENLRSLRARYSDISEWEECAQAYGYERISPYELIERVYAEQDPAHAKYYPALKDPLDVFLIRAQVANACDCYDYQACETDDYRDTVAALIVQQVRDNFPPPSDKDKRRTLWGF